MASVQSEPPAPAYARDVSPSKISHLGASKTAPARRRTGRYFNQSRKDRAAACTPRNLNAPTELVGWMEGGVRMWRGLSRCHHLIRHSPDRSGVAERDCIRFEHSATPRLVQYVALSDSYSAELEVAAARLTVRKKISVSVSSSLGDVSLLRRV
jgi:hypothetical protein